MTIGLLVGALCLTLNVVCISLVCPRSVQLSTVIGFNYQRALLWMGRHRQTAQLMSVLLSTSCRSSLLDFSIVCENVSACFLRNDIVDLPPDSV